MKRSAAVVALLAALTLLVSCGGDDLAIEPEQLESAIKGTVAIPGAPQSKLVVECQPPAEGNGIGEAWTCHVDARDADPEGAVNDERPGTQVELAAWVLDDEGVYRARSPRLRSAVTAYPKAAAGQAPTAAASKTPI